MKLPSSSSVFFATLAISSSSSALAAPAGDIHGAGLSTSPSEHDLHDAHVGAPMQMDDMSEAMAARSDASQFVARTDDQQHVMGQVADILGGMPLVGGLVNSLLGPPLRSLAVNPGNGTQAGNSTSPDIQPESVEALKAALGEIQRMLNNTGSALPGPVGDVVGGVAGSAPVVGQQNIADVSSTSSFASASASYTSASSTSSASAYATPSAVAAAAAALDQTSSTFSTTSTIVPSSSSTPAVSAAAASDAGPSTPSTPSSASSSASASATPSSPPMPVNPPNTPVPLPVNPPVSLPLPINH